MYSTTLEEIQDTLQNENLLREVVIDNHWQLRIHDPSTLETVLTDLSYDSMNTGKDTLFFCKGTGFKEHYLTDALQQGTRFYVSEKIYENQHAVGIIVHDVRKAMAVLARNFYGNPQKKLHLVGITGTKGKTTTAYFLESILRLSSRQKTALFSSIANSEDGKNYKEAHLTTPESLDLYQMMAASVRNGMTHLVMEVSSQAYKLHRVYGLHFDVGVFLNISTDHIGPLEHPSFEDYLYCKRQLLVHSDRSVLYRGSMHFDLLKEEAEQAGDVFIYGDQHPESHYYIDDQTHLSSTFLVASTQEDTLEICGEYSLSLPGDFNKENALSAIIVAALLGASKEHCQQGIRDTKVPGRMDVLSSKNRSTIYVDYAHNYISLKRLLEFVRQEHPDGKVITVLGSPGGKGLSRRKDFGEVLSALSDLSILTADDANFDDPADIADDIKSHMVKGALTEFIPDRELAIERAIRMAGSKDAVVLAGKGDQTYQIIRGEWVPYPGDANVARKELKHLQTLPSLPLE